MARRQISCRTVKVGLVLVAALALSGPYLPASPLYAQDEVEVPVQPAEGMPAAETRTPAAARAPRRGGGFLYTVRPGDSLGSIASSFDLQVSDIAGANHLDPEAMLLVGQVLRIPNPFAARMKTLSGENKKLTGELAAANRKVVEAAVAQNDLKGQVEQLAAGNAVLDHRLGTMPWWQGAAYSATIIALLMLGVSILAVMQWYLLRRRYVGVADMNDSLRRLDQRYRFLLAKAELRMQELYGRRRRGLAEGHERPQLPEEAEMDRLDQQLREVLEHHLAQLGGPRRRRQRGRWREQLGGVGSPVEARSVRR